MSKSTYTILVVTGAAGEPQLPSRKLREVAVTGTAARCL